MENGPHRLYREGGFVPNPLYSPQLPANFLVAEASGMTSNKAAEGSPTMASSSCGDL